MPLSRAISASDSSCSGPIAMVATSRCAGATRRALADRRWAGNPPAPRAGRPDRRAAVPTARAMIRRSTARRRSPARHLATQRRGLRRRCDRRSADGRSTHFLVSLQLAGLEGEQLASERIGERFERPAGFGATTNEHMLEAGNGAAAAARRGSASCPCPAHPVPPPGGTHRCACRVRSSRWRCAARACGPPGVGPTARGDPGRAPPVDRDAGAGGEGCGSRAVLHGIGGSLQTEAVGQAVRTPTSRRCPAACGPVASTR